MQIWNLKKKEERIRPARSEAISKLIIYTRNVCNDFRIYSDIK